VQAFGRLLRREVDAVGDQEQHELSEALEALHGARGEVQDLLLADPRSRQGLWELNSALLTTADRMLIELGPAALVRPRGGSSDVFTALSMALHAAERVRASTSRRVDRIALDRTDPPRTGEAGSDSPAAGELDLAGDGASAEPAPRVPAPPGPTPGAS
jgi:hypothetical protein